MAEYIECRDCTSPNCNGCNIYTLSIMLREGKFDRLMDNSRSIDQTACVVKAIPVDFKPVGTKCPTGKTGAAAFDVVWVVRCKDCENARQHKIFPHSRRCSIEDYRFTHKETHFCGYGKRRTNNA